MNQLLAILLMEPAASGESGLAVELVRQLPFQVSQPIK